MQFTTVLAIFTSIAAVSALPGFSPYSITGSNAEAPTCGDGHTVACCDTSLIDEILDTLLGSKCTTPGLLSIANSCPTSSTYCCPVNQEGLINVSLTCSPITI